MAEVNLIWLSWELRQACPGITPRDAQLQADRILETARLILKQLKWEGYSVHDIYLQFHSREY